jgi:beta-glucuronidase
MSFRPENNGFREAISLDGIWHCTIEQGDWSNGFEGGYPIAVPGSWNEQLSEAGLMNHTGTVWYQRDVVIPKRATNQSILLHFGSADYHAVIYWNGTEVGRSGALMMPILVDLSDIAEAGAVARLVVRVTAELPDHGPMQRVHSHDYKAEGRYKDEYFPAVRFDFFPFGGLNRPVQLCLTPGDFECPIITTQWHNGSAGLQLKWSDTPPDHPVCAYLDDEKVAQLQPGQRDLSLTIQDLKPWHPDAPHLYTLRLEPLDEHRHPFDRVTRKIGFRSVQVDDGRLLLNGEPITLRGFGKHEDTPFSGRGQNLPALIKDFQLLQWTGANSVRTSHYPYDETFLDMADEMGILVISEVFSVNLDFRKVTDEDLDLHKCAVTALIARDGYHPSVIAWSLANEPGYLGEEAYRKKSGPYWEELFAHARDADSTRPLTVANVQYAGEDDPVFGFCDFLSVNRYYGWYHEPGQIDRAAEQLSTLLDRLSEAHGKPVFVSEFGADAVAGMHATTDQMWTEEYQSRLIEAYWQIIEEHPACMGGHVWNFADFRTAQHGRRAVMNRKGVFTRERDPKRAAFTLRQLWSGN